MTPKPDPSGNPVTPYSIFHSISVSPAIHDNLADDDVILSANKAVGCWQNGTVVKLNGPTQLLESPVPQLAWT